MATANRFYRRCEVKKKVMEAGSSNTCSPFILDIETQTEPLQA